MLLSGCFLPFCFYFVGAKVIICFEITKHFVVFLLFFSIKVLSNVPFLLDLAPKFVIDESVTCQINGFYLLFHDSTDTLAANKKPQRASQQAEVSKGSPLASRPPS